eukprot:gnl/TRDRNA2_/TRDRNA2_170932_c0_seq3.p1 gnl/TRDRNA2_/TRDRNA2_170932_c0~~gnl/TRDRNA2_/TRDRNA2_170932_c0_seq3.p1  ORF type:complete len:290 (-),score=63.09 gnl/TRDRNA2_/TRDRNA2_170932_c0_seq3:290-1159(-)
MMAKVLVAFAILNIVVGHAHDHWNVAKLFGGGMASELAKQARDQVVFEIENLKQEQPEVIQDQEQKECMILATFDNAKGKTYKWHAMNDPVMGGRSHSTFSVEKSEGHFKGTCAIVPFLKAPGFCKISTQQSIFSSGSHFASASRFIDGSLYLEVETTTPDYEGFKVAFGAKNATRPSGAMHHSSPTFKAGFKVPGKARTTVEVPFNSFSVDWSDFTGRCDTKDPNNGFQHHCCSPEHPEVCPTAQHLAEITSLELWAEGVAGDFDLKIFSIGAGLSQAQVHQQQTLIV